MLSFALYEFKEVVNTWLAVSCLMVNYFTPAYIFRYFFCVIYIITVNLQPCNFDIIHFAVNVINKYFRGVLVSMGVERNINLFVAILSVIYGSIGSIVRIFFGRNIIGFNFKLFSGTH